MASLFGSRCSLIFAQRSLNSNEIRRFPLRSLIALGNRSYSRFQQRSLLLLSRSSGRRQTPRRFRSSYAAGIVKSEYTVEIPDISLSDFVLSKFSEYGEDVAMVSYREASKNKHIIAIN